MGKEVHNVEEFAEAVKNSEEGEHIVFIDKSNPREDDAKKQKAFKNARTLARKKDISTSVIAGGFDRKTAINNNWFQVEYKLPEGYLKTDYDIEKGRYRCPKCGEYTATKHSGKMIGGCNNCDADLSFKKRSSTFVKEV